MRRSLAVLTIAALMLAARVPAHADDLLFSYFGDYVDALRTQIGIPGIAGAIVSLDGPPKEYYFGLRDIDQNKEARYDTTFQLDGVTQIVTASLVLRCVEEGRLSLDDHVGDFEPSSPDAGATIRQILTHTSGPADNLVFTYRPQRLGVLASVVHKCSGESLREGVEKLLDRFAMFDSVPGMDAANLDPPPDGIPTADTLKKYADAIGRLATPYAVNQRRASLSEYTATTLAPASGLIVTARDYWRFELALRDGAILQPDTLAAAWQAPVDHDGRRLPHGLGWFVQTYNGKPIIWQFGVSENASSSLLVSVPSRGMTLILMANSDGLVKPFALSAGDVTVSPFARVFLGIFAR